MATRIEFDRKQVKADEFKGKKVIDREGIEYGKVRHVHINSDTLEVVGITVHEGLNKDYFLSRDYLDRFTEESVLLSSAPIRTEIPVVDIDGRKIGKVKRLHISKETNELESIEVSEGLTGSRIFHTSEIWGVGEKIILRQTRDEYKKP
ncbi:MAG: PRC-barrel domain containing protein [Thaumarchaeota archaeon]|nr:MAG: PRC-barrel domain containing protein [Nitrososphaerota archaeon]